MQRCRTAVRGKAGSHATLERPTRRQLEPRRKQPAQCGHLQARCMALHPPPSRCAAPLHLAAPAGEVRQGRATRAGRTVGAVFAGNGERQAPDRRMANRDLGRTASEARVGDHRIAATDVQALESRWPCPGLCTGDGERGGGPRARVERQARTELRESQVAGHDLACLETECVDRRRGRARQRRPCRQEELPSAGSHAPSVARPRRHAAVMHPSSV